MRSSASSVTREVRTELWILRMRRSTRCVEACGMSASPFADLRGIPYYDEPTLYMNLAGRLWAWEFDGWKPESMSWKTGCYIHGGLSNTQTIFRGPDVQEFFSSIAVNDFERFDLGSMKHSIYCTEEGLITAHAILQRNGEDEYRYFAGQPWPHYKLRSAAGRFRVEMEPSPTYLFQIAGPTSLEVLERVTDESLRDIGFLRFRDAKIGGKIGRGRSHWHVRQPRLRAARPARRGSRDLRRGLPGGQGPRHPAPRLGDVPRQPRRGRLPSDELDVRERCGSRSRVPGV